MGVPQLVLPMEPDSLQTLNLGISSPPLGLKAVNW